ncbi:MULTISPECIES: Msa family membrane protein [unclassified Streptococcus]|uniref:Msa family membrane protein n=1 Tax=unclassified Streptococcus TaxID=2608887 RepID=UPI0011B6EACE|nr:MULTISPECIES: Msa family membrane protein [unclassified Streptococcus]TWS94576.1 hypothetical protein FRX52_03665 [Streptococcus sp. sy018]TWT14410.1 hypothetical protein FRX51_04475 [Streptococcus sp. sy010]
MLFYIIISSILNILAIIIGTKYLSHLTILGFTFIIYLFPIILNSVLSVLAMLKKNVTVYYCFVFPLFSLLTYIVIGLFLDGSTLWVKFVQNNTITNGEMYIKVNNSLIEPSQIIFVFLLYFLVEYIGLKILERMVQKNGSN